MHDGNGQFLPIIDYLLDVTPASGSWGLEKRALTRIEYGAAKANASIAISRAIFADCERLVRRPGVLDLPGRLTGRTCRQSR